MTQNRDLRATVGYKVDQQSVATAANANSKVAASFTTVHAAAAALGADVLKLNPQLAALAAQENAVANAGQRLAQAQSTASSNASRLTSSLSAQRAPVQDLTNLYKSLEDQAKRAGAAQDVAASSGGGLRSVSGNPIESGFGTLRSLSGAAGLIAGNSQAGSTIAAFAGLTSVLGPAGIAAAALAVGIRAVTDWQERATESGKAYAAVLEQIAGVIAAGATTQDLQKQIQQQQTMQQVAQESQNELLRINDLFVGLVNTNAGTTEAYNNALRLLNEDLYNATGGVLGLKDGLGTTEIGVDVLTGALNAGKGKIDDATASIAFLNSMLNSSAVAANDAAVAAAKLRDAQVAAAQETLEIDRLTAAQRSEQAARNQRDIEILRGMISTLDLSTDAAEALSVQIGELTVRNRELNEVIISTADLLAREKQFRDNAAKALQDLNQQYQLEAQALERAAEIRQRITDLEIDTAEKLQSARADAAQRERDAIADAEERRREIVAEGAERRQEIELDDAERRAEIIKRFNTDYSNAVGERDALAAYKAKQTRDEELDKQSKAYRKQLDALEKQMDKQLAAVNKGLDKQLRSIQDNLARQERAIADAYQKQLRGLQQSLAEQNALAENARQQQLVLQRNYNALVAQAELMHRAAQYKTLYDWGEKTLVYVDNFGRRFADSIRTWFENGGYVVGGPDSGVYPGSSTSGNNLGSSFSSMRDASALTGGGTSAFRGGMYRTPTNVSNNRSVNITFAPNIRSTMTEKQVRRITDDWFTDLRRMRF